MQNKYYRDMENETTMLTQITRRLSKSLLELQTYIITYATTDKNLKKIFNFLILLFTKLN